MFAHMKFVFAVILLVVLPACATQPTQSAQTTNVSAPATTNSSSSQKTYNDPFTYCAAIGTIDAPDIRYTGPQISDQIINGYRIAAGLESSTEPMEMFRKTTVWRCMDNQVYACNFGANLPCNSKANTDQTPSPAMENYCKTNPDSDFVPMSVTGHESIYSWHCVKDAAKLLDQVAKVDAAGYLANIWYPITPSASPSNSPTVTVHPSTEDRQLLFISNRAGSYNDLYLLDITSLQVIRLTHGDSNIFSGPFSSDRKRILFTGFGLTHSYVGAMNGDGSDPVNLTNQTDSDDAFPDWSPDGSQIVFASRRDGNNEIYVMDSNGDQLKRLTNNSADDFAPAWSPDGQQIAFLSDRESTTGVYSIYLINTDGSGVKRLTNDKGNDYTPAWSPDGSQIAFRSVQNGQSDIYRVKVNGSNILDLTNDPAEDWSPAWSPDGSLIAFQSNRGGNWEIYTMKADGTDPINLTNNPADDQIPYWR